MNIKTARVPRRRARRGEGDLLRDDILDAATQLLIDTADADAVSIRAVADSVGVTPPSIYLHFADKDQLVFEVCRRQFKALDQWLTEALEGIADPLERLRAMARSYIDFGRQHPATYRVLFMHKPQQEPDTAEIIAMLGESGFGRLVEEVQHCLDDGLFRGDAQLISVELWAAVHGVTSLLISKPHFPWPDVEAMTSHLTTTLLRGLAP